MTTFMLNYMQICLHPVTNVMVGCVVGSRAHLMRDWYARAPIRTVHTTLEIFCRKKIKLSICKNIPRNILEKQTCTLSISKHFYVSCIPADMYIPVLQLQDVLPKM